MIAQPLHAEELRGGRHRSVEPEADLGRRRLREGVRHLEYTVGDRELAAGRNFHIAAADIDRRGAPGDAHVDVGIANRGQPLHRPDLGAMADDLDRQAFVGNRWAGRLEGGPGCIGGDHQPFDRAAQHSSRPRHALARRRSARAASWRQPTWGAGDAERQPWIIWKGRCRQKARCPDPHCKLALLDVDALVAGTTRSLSRNRLRMSGLASTGPAEGA